MDLMNETELIERAAKGDAAAFEALITPYEGKMYALCLRYCTDRGGRSEDAQDCLQEAMLHIYRSIGKFKGQSAFSTWAYRITVNACLDHLRRRKSRPQVSLDQLVDSGWAPEDGSETPERSVMRKELKRALMKSIDELPKDMRDALVLRDLHGFSYDEIAAVLQANIGTVKSRISRARSALRSKILSKPELFDAGDV